MRAEFDASKEELLDKMDVLNMVFLDAGGLSIWEVMSLGVIGGYFGSSGQTGDGLKIGYLRWLCDAPNPNLVVPQPGTAASAVGSSSRAAAAAVGGSRDGGSGQLQAKRNITRQEARDMGFKTKLAATTSSQLKGTAL